HFLSFSSYVEEKLSFDGRSDPGDGCCGFPVRRLRQQGGPTSPGSASRHRGDGAATGPGGAGRIHRADGVGGEGGGASARVGAYGCGWLCVSTSWISIFSVYSGRLYFCLY